MIADAAPAPAVLGGLAIVLLAVVAFVAFVILSILAVIRKKKNQQLKQ